MKRIISTLAICIFTLLTITGNAQEKLATYDNTYIGKNYDILMSINGKGNFTLLINAMPLDDSGQLGGIMVPERKYFRFLDNIKLAKLRYEEGIKTAKVNHVKELNKTLKIYGNADAYFKQGNMYQQLDVPLNFEFIVTESDGKPDYLLFISTSELTATNHPSIKSKGFGLVFSSPEEIDNFISQISPDKVNVAVDRTMPIKSRSTKKDAAPNRNAPAKSGLLSKITVGIKAGYNTLLGMNDFHSDATGAYTLKSSTSEFSNSFNAGVFGRIGSKKLYFQPELQYSMGQKNYAVSFWDNHIQLVQFNKKVNISTLDIPLLLGYKVFEKNSVSLRLLAGPKLRLNAGSTFEYPFFHTNGTVSTSDLITDIKAAQLGMEAGLEFDYSRISLGARYNLINDMYHTQFNSRTLDNLSANALVISLGWKLFSR